MIILRIGFLVALGSTLALAEDEVIKCPGGECVKLHLCRDGSIITDGSNLIDIRFNPDDPCEHYLLKCCTVPDDEGDQVIESPSASETEFIEPPSSGPHSGNQISSNTGSTASSGSSATTGSTGSIGSSGSAGPSGLPGTSGTTGSTVLSGSEISSGPSASSAGHGREQEGAIGNSGNYYGGSYSHGGGSFSSTFSQSSSMSSSSSSSQSYQQQWTGSQGQVGMGMGWGSNIGGSPTYGSGSPGFIGYNTGYPVMIGQSSQMGSVGHGTGQSAGYGTGQSEIAAHGSGLQGLGAGVTGSPKHSEVHPGSPGKGAGPTVPIGGGIVNTSHGTEQMGSVGGITAQSQHSTGYKESIGHTIMQTGISSGGVSGSQVGSSDGVTGTVQKVPPGGSLAQTGHGTVQTNFVGPATGQTQHNADQQGYIINHTGTTAGGLSGSQHGSNVGGSGTGQPVPSGGGVSPTGHGSAQMGSLGLATGQTQHSTGQQGHAISQIGTTTGGLSGSQHGSGAGGTKTEQMVPVAGSIAQTGHIGVTTGQSQHSTGQQGHTISQTGTTVGGLSGSQHSLSSGGIGKGKPVPVGGGVSPTGHGTTQMGSVGLVTGQTQHSTVQQGHTISQTGTAAGGLGATGTGPKVPEGGVVSPSSNGTVMGSASAGQIQHNTGHKGSIAHTVSQAGTSGGGLSGSQQGPTGGAVGIGTGQTIPAGGHGITQTGSAGSSTGQKEYGVGQILSMDHYSGQTGTTEGGSLGVQHGPTGVSARPPLSGSLVGGYENLPSNNLESSNLLAGDLHSGSQTSGHYLQEQISIGQQATHASGTQSGAYQVIGSSGKPVATKPMHGTGNIAPSVGTVSKDQTKDAASLNAGISHHEQVSSHHQYQDNISTINLTQSINSAGSTQGHGKGQSGSSTVKHHDGDGCTSHTQKHTTHTQHHGYIKGQSQHSYGSGYNNMYYSGTTVNPILPPQENMGCGFRNPDGVGFRITGNSDGEAEYGEFPWMVAILKEEKALDQVINVYQCGGSLIHPQVVLTAAHCVQNKQPHEIKVRLGEWDTQTTNEIHDHQDRNVVEIVVHDKFYKGGLFNDFALLFLDKPTEIIETVNTVCLPPQDFNFDLSRCFASGWGKDVFGKEGKYQVILKKIELPVMPFNKCQDALRTTRLGKRFILNKSFICAGGEPKKDTCKGDGGSPLVCPIPGSANRFYQAGIVAWGIGCGEHGIPGVYANVAGSRAWIDGHLTQRSIPHDYYIAV